NLAVAYIRMRKLEDAVEFLYSSLEQKPDHTDAIANLAYVFTLEQRYAEAVEQLSVLQTLPGCSPIYLKSFGDTLVSLGAIRPGVEVYRMAIAKGLDSASIADIRANNPDLQW
ncbi:MAG: tetratricopeptide repeat protein, partial [candidate division Zixibacteria bacterium]|nr:tetratricopeptide repeat protein [candidate division Zixibacteria bacterium]